MLIAHIPAGYILTKVLPPRKKKLSLIATALFFAVAPDLDLIYFYTLGGRRVVHHAYVTHWPLFWVGLFGIAFIISFVLHKKSWHPYLGIGLAAVLLHLVLDSVAAEIYWLAPFSDKYINLVQVPATYSWWVQSFVTHWTFALELAICLTALFLFIRTRMRKAD